METIPLIAPLAAASAPEPGPTASETAGDSLQSTVFEDLVAQLAEISSKVARDNSDKPSIQPEPPSSAQKTSGKKMAAAPSDAGPTSEIASGVIATVLIDLTGNKKEMPSQGNLGAAAELLNRTQVLPLNRQSTRLATAAIADDAGAAALPPLKPASLVHVNSEPLLAPASLEGTVTTTSESAKPAEPQFVPAAIQIIPAVETETNRQSPLTFLGSPSSEALNRVHAAESRTIASAVAGSPAVSPGKIYHATQHQDQAFVILSTRLLRDGSLELRLDPPELGSIRISLSPDNNGATQALVTADRTETLDLVRRHIEAFRAEAGNYGLSNLDFRFESGSQNRSSPEPEKKRPAARPNDSFATGFDGDTIYSAPLSGYGMDVFA